MKGSNKTYCIGFWAVENNQKRSLQHYLKYLPETLKMLSGCNIVFIYNSREVLAEVIRIANNYAINLVHKKALIVNLPAREAANDILLRTEEFPESLDSIFLDDGKEKAHEHYYKDYTRGGPQAYMDMLTVWLSKVPIVAEIVEENPFNSLYFAWVDVSIARFNGKRDYYNITKLNDANRKISFYRGKRCKKLKKLALNASYLSGDKYAWKKLTSLYWQVLLYQRYEDYPNDEETVLDACVTRVPSLFRTINPKKNIILVRFYSKFGLGRYWRH